jgi:predicted NBD/HSP70 family sugar kinase
MNQRRILQSMARLRRASRIELGRAAHMSQPTVSRIVERLLADGVFVPADIRSNGDERALAGGLGRPSTVFEFDAQRPRFLAVHVGVTHTRLARLPFASPTVESWDASFPTPGDGDAWQKQFDATCAELRLPKDLIATVLCVPGIVDERQGRVLLSPNLRWIEAFHFEERLNKAQHGAAVFIHEIRALARGQMVIEPELRDFLLVDFGSGVGAAAVVGGRLYHGSLPLSGELGHTPVIGNQRRCGCGGIGCIETLVSRRAILEAARQERFADSLEELAARLQNGPLPAWLRAALDAAAMGIAASLNTLGVRTVILTGYMSDLPPVAIEYLRTAISTDTMWARFGTIECRTAARRRLVGLASVAMERTVLALPEDAAHV